MTWISDDLDIYEVRDPKDVSAGTFRRVYHTLKGALITITSLIIINSFHAKEEKYLYVLCHELEHRDVSDTLFKLKLVSNDPPEWVHSEPSSFTPPEETKKVKE